jgi:hypothetical protein
LDGRGDEVIGGEDAVEVGPKMDEEDKVGRAHMVYVERLALLRGIMAVFGAAALTINVMLASLESLVEVGHIGL